MARSSSDKTRLLTIVAAAVITAGCVIAYANSFSVPFLWDDETAITTNVTIRHLATAFSPPTSATVEGRPILNASLALNYAVSGLEVWSYHLVNLLLHVLAALTLFGIVRRTLQRLWDHSGEIPSTAGGSAWMLALIVALLWAVHPLQTESVTYVVQRAEAMMALFYLLTLYCAIRGWEVREHGHANNSVTMPPGNSECPASTRRSRRGMLWDVAAVACCALGMATKEVMATAPLLVVLYDRCFLAGTFVEAIKKRWKLYLGLTATWAVLAGLLASSSQRGGSAGFGGHVSWGQYGLTQFGVILHYLRLSIWPHPLVLDYLWVAGPPFKNPLTDLLPGLIVVAALLALTVWGLARRKMWAFLGAAFFLLLAPTSSIYPIADPAFEHRMYLPLAAVVAAIVLAAWWVWTRRWHSPEANTPKPTSPGAGAKDHALVPADRTVRAWQVPVILAALVAAALIYGTIRRNYDYRSDMAIWQDTLAKAPDNPRAHLNVAGNYADRHENAKAIEEYTTALKLAPTYPHAWDGRGSVYLEMGRPDLALADYDQALRVDPNFVPSLAKIGRLYARLNRPEEAIKAYSRAITLSPHPVLYNDRGSIYRGMNKLPEALDDYTAAIRLSPAYAQAYANRAGVYQRIGRMQEAQADMERARQLSGRR